MLFKWFSRVIGCRRVMVYTGGSRAAATTKTECFVIIVKSLKPLTIITKHSILDVAAALDPTVVCKLYETTWLEISRVVFNVV